MSTVSSEQVAARRRALGRLMRAKSLQASVLIGDMKSSPDLQFLTAKEQELVTKQLDVMGKVFLNFKKIGDRLEASE